MLSAARTVVSRVALRGASSTRMLLLQQQKQQQKSATTMFRIQSFSTAPPTFLDAAQVTDRIVTVVGNFDKVDADKVSADTKFEDLGLDSLDTVEVVMAIEDEFAIEIPDAEADKIASVADAIEYIASHPMAK